MKRLTTPITYEQVDDLHVGDMIQINGRIFCGRDAVLPKICSLIGEEALSTYGIDLTGSVIFHTAVSPAGIGPTSSNKVEIEGSMPLLSKSGVKIHLGKGVLKAETIRELNRYGSVYAVIPPVTALLGNNTLSQRLLAFPELGMEAFYELEVRDFPAIVAAAHGESMF